MYTIVALTSVGTKQATCNKKAYAADLDTAVETAMDFAEFLGMTTDARLIGTTVEKYGKYRHFDHRPCERGRRAVIVVPGEK